MYTMKQPQLIKEKVLEGVRRRGNHFSRSSKKKDKQDLNGGMVP